MVALDFCWIPTPNSLFLGWLFFCCNNSQFIDNVLLNWTPRAIGGEFGDPKLWQGSMGPFLCLKYLPTNRGQHQEKPCTVFSQVFQLAQLQFILPAEVPTKALCILWQRKLLLTLISSLLLAELWAPSCRSVSLAISPPCLPICAAWMHRSLRHASILSRNPLLSFIWSNC